MFQKIVVPLDGSKLAECVLEHVEQLTNNGKTSEVVLVSVTESITGVVARTDDARLSRPLMAVPSTTETPVSIGKKQQQAEKYLDKIAHRLDKKGIKVHFEVLIGNPAEEIVRYAQENGCGLIALASHGRSGVSRWAFGSVADKILRASSVPVLIVKVPGSQPGR
ncbi:MAG: universal stress protein [Chloroflexi bacterium]|nr:universal stress protein [Chloroflexota bacterium]